MKTTKAMLKQMAQEVVDLVLQTGCDLGEACEEYASTGDEGINSSDLMEAAENLMP